VIFDDTHQGDARLYDPAAFYRDPRLRASVIFLVGLWLLYLLGYSNRFVGATLAARGVSGLSFVRAVGGFYARMLQPPAVAQGLFRHFFNALRRRAGLPANGEPAWEMLARAPRVDAVRLAELRTLHARVVSGERADLVRIHNLMLELKGQLS
jgi:hypothetical protein